MVEDVLYNPKLQKRSDQGGCLGLQSGLRKVEQIQRSAKMSSHIREKNPSDNIPGPMWLTISETELSEIPQYSSN